MARYLLYVALEHGEGASEEFDTLDEVVEGVTELTRRTFESGRRLVTFSVGDMELTQVEASPQFEIQHDEDCPAGEWKGRECTCPAPMIEKGNTNGQG